MTQAANMKLPATRRRNRGKVSVAKRERRLVERVVEALTWLNEHAPGRAYETLIEALRERKDAR